MKWKRTKKGSKDQAKDGKPTPTDEDEHKFETDERDESDCEDNFHISVDSPNPDIDEPQSPPGPEVKREERSNPFYCSGTGSPHLLSPHHFLTGHCPPFNLSHNTFLRSEPGLDDNHN